MKLKNIEVALICAFAIAAAVSITSFAGTCDNIRGEVLRLHVLANSDSKEDQALKLKVRDAVLKKGSDIFEVASTEKDAESKLQTKVALLQKTAQDKVKELGYDYKVTVKIGNSYFNTRTYDNKVTLPAGTYRAVKVLIGSGQGHNWWCVMFPPMCLPAAESSAKIDDVLSKKQLKVVESNPKYEVRFKLVEVYENLRDKFIK